MVSGIIFGNGFLGQRLGKAYGYRVVPRSEVDTSDFFAVGSYIKRNNPDVVINAVGKTGHHGSLGIDGCIGHETEMRNSNVFSADNISIACEKYGAYFVHLGSGCIYSGDNDGKGFTELDAPNFGARQLYSDSKLLAEKMLRKRPGLLLRIRMPIDDRPHPRNLIDKLRGYDRVIDIQNSMTTIPDMIPALKTMIENKLHGVYNFVNPGTISAAEIMTMYRDIVDPTKSVNVMPLEDLSKVVREERSNCVLSDGKLQRNGIVLPEIHTAVETCLKNYLYNKNMDMNGLL